MHATCILRLSTLISGSSGSNTVGSSTTTWGSTAAAMRGDSGGDSESAFPKLNVLFPPGGFVTRVKGRAGNVLDCDTFVGFDMLRLVVLMVAGAGYQQQCLL
jgi:hypothetical protein